MIKKAILFIFLATLVVLVGLMLVGYYFKENNQTATAVSPLSETKADILRKSAVHYESLINKLKDFPSIKIENPYVILGDWPLNGDGVCYVVAINGNPVGEFSDLHFWDKKILGYRCNPDKTVQPYPESDYFGDSEIEFTSVDLITGDIKKLTPVNWSFLSNPKVCGSYIAYWGVSDETEGNSQNSKVFGHIYNWITQEPSLEKQISSKQIATDDSGFFQSPEWNLDCKAATFTDEGVAKILNF